MLPEPDQSAAQCLDTLEASLRAVLLHTGSALGDPANFDATNITLTRSRISKALPSALDNFNRALGGLELALLRAKSALHRDLAKSQQRWVESSSIAATHSQNGHGVSSSTDADTTMLDPQQTAILSHVFGPPTPQKSIEHSAESHGNEAANSLSVPGATQPPADDPLAHPKPSGQPLQSNTAKNDEDTASVMEDTATTKGELVSTSNHADLAEASGTALKQGGDTGSDEITASATNGASTHESDVGAKEVEQGASTLNAANDQASALLPDLEFYANTNGEANANLDDNSFRVENQPGVANGVDGDAADDSGGLDNSQNQDDFLATLSDDFLQDGAGDGTSFEEQFDFSTFDFGGGGAADGDGNEGNGGDGQTWDSNFFDESLFNLDGEGGD